MVAPFPPSVPPDETPGTPETQGKEKAAEDAISAAGITPQASAPVAAPLKEREVKESADRVVADEAIKSLSDFFESIISELALKRDHDGSDKGNIKYNEAIGQIQESLQKAQHNLSDPHITKAKITQELERVRDELVDNLVKKFSIDGLRPLRIPDFKGNRLFELYKSTVEGKVNEAALSHIFYDMQRRLVYEKKLQEFAEIKDYKGIERIARNCLTDKVFPDLAAKAVKMLPEEQQKQFVARSSTLKPFAKDDILSPSASVEEFQKAIYLLRTDPKTTAKIYLDFAKRLDPKSDKKFPEKMEILIKDIKSEPAENAFFALVFLVTINIEAQEFRNVSRLLKDLFITMSEPQFANRMDMRLALIDVTCKIIEQESKAVRKSAMFKDGCEIASTLHRALPSDEIGRQQWNTVISRLDDLIAAIGKNYCYEQTIKTLLNWGDKITTPDKKFNFFIDSIKTLNSKTHIEGIKEIFIYCVRNRLSLNGFFNPIITQSGSPGENITKLVKLLVYYGLDIDKLPPEGLPRKTIDEAFKVRQQIYQQFAIKEIDSIRLDPEAPTPTVAPTDITKFIIAGYTSPSPSELPPEKILEAADLCLAIAPL